MFEENYGNEAVRALNRASRADLETWDVLSPRGFLMVALEAESALFATELDAMGLSEISVTDARDRVPILADGIVRAGISEAAQDIDTGALLDTYARITKAHGGQIRTSSGVESIARNNGAWSLRARGQTLEADVVVNAAGAWADLLAEMAGVRPVGLTPYRRSIARLPAPGGHDVRSWPMLFGPGETWYAKPDAGGWIVSPADEDPIEPMDAWADDMVLAEGLARYEAHVNIPVTRVETNWAGLRTFAPDRAPVIGEAMDAPGFFWCAGQGGYGFQTSPAVSRLTADLVLGRRPALGSADVERLSPARFAQAKSGV